MCVWRARLHPKVWAIGAENLECRSEVVAPAALDRVFQYTKARIGYVGGYQSSCCTSCSISDAVDLDEQKYERATPVRSSANVRQ
jgi:hypothetical protein